jgi:hypothetical protein
MTLYRAVQSGCGPRDVGCSTNGAARGSHARSGFGRPKWRPGASAVRGPLLPHQYVAADIDVFETSSADLMVVKLVTKHDGCCEKAAASDLTSR